MILTEYLRKQARNRPGSKAVVCGGASLTYQELDALSDNGACGLFELGVKKGDCVGIAYDHSEKAVLSIFSILKAGALFVPLNPSLPKERVDYIKKNAKISFIFGRDLDIYTLAATDKKLSLPKITPADKMAIYYTSGSTGTPKGVVLLHKNPVAVIGPYCEMMDVKEGVSMASYVSLSFVVALNDLAMAVSAGATLHLLENEIYLNVWAVGEYFTKNNIVYSLLPVSFGRKLIDGYDLPEACKIGLCGEKFMPPAKPFAVYNCYGLTEASAVQLAGRFDGKQASLLPLEGTTAEIIDGQLVLSGDCVCAGYTGALFKDNKLHTGDLAHYTKEGKIVIEGRRDFQLKIRGYRIEPTEIDSKVLGVKGVAESVTVKRNQRLVTFYAGSAAAVTIQNEISRFLPKYMVPSEYVRLDALPKTLAGKIDRKALPEIARSRQAVDENDMPFTDTQKNLAKIWASVLGMGGNAISLSDDFEALGGDSLSVIMLQIEIEAKFGKLVTPAELFQAKTLEAQAKLVEDGRGERIHIFRSEGEKEPLYFAHTGNSGSEVYRRFFEMLPENQPFYVFEHHNILFSEGEFEGIKDLAKRYIRYLPQAKDYRLGGWSFGGILAFEMGLQLQEQGIKSDLILIDPVLFQKVSETNYRQYLESDPLFERFRNMGLIDKLERNNAFIIKEIVNYRPGGAYEGKITLFRMTGEEKPRDNGFGAYALDLQIINIDDIHDRCLINRNTIKTIVKELY